MKKKNRTVAITVRVNEKEKEEILQFAELNHQTLSDFIRQSIYKNKPKQE